jgi:hypothetical protein
MILSKMILGFEGVMLDSRFKDNDADASGEARTDVVGDEFDVILGGSFRVVTRFSA